MLTQSPNPIKSSPKISLSSNFSASNTFSPLQFPNFPSKPKTLNFKLLCSQSPTPNPSAPPSSSPVETLINVLRIIPDWADRTQERGMRQRRTLYDHEKWMQHRSSYRHLRHLLSSLSSRVILSLIPPVIVFTLVAVVIASYNTAVALDLLPGFFPLLRSSSLPYQLTAPALALFEEGRKAWTEVIAGANDFARQIISSVENSGDAQLKKALLQYIMAFPVALKCHVIYGSDIGRDLQDLLEVDDLLVVLNSKHRPGCIIQFISRSLQLLKLEESQRNMLVGVLIEEPFPMLALDDLCNSVRNNVQEALANERAIHARLAAKGKIQSEPQFQNGQPRP
ncbi:hypothetical protein D8674_000128 [Pyrus ussuriensis x Pyrus communis]|uniref:Uncharacterized protein n=1 Tax=Pyrus ussuriensis x Pyrus communis TaxID=2448454 RepID=A0A5N5F281_9ROSA|nr:hypothetical protein D8674_000128 [Pyrus ussuriensis x Pyrus communis]